MPQYNIFWWEILLTSQDNCLIFLGNILTLCEKWRVFLKRGLLKSQCHQWHCPKLFTLLTYFPSSLWNLAFPGGSDSKESAHNVGDLGSIPGLGRFPGGGNGNPLQYSCLENPHRQRSLVGYSPWGHRESDTTEWLSTGGMVGASGNLTGCLKGISVVVK